MLDKGRAELAGKAGEYHFACPLDQRFLSFTGLAADDILSLLKQGKSDSEVLAWIREHAKQKRMGRSSIGLNIIFGAARPTTKAANILLKRFKKLPRIETISRPGLIFLMSTISLVSVAPMNCGLAENAGGLATLSPR